MMLSKMISGKKLFMILNQRWLRGLVVVGFLGLTIWNFGLVCIADEPRHVGLPSVTLQPDQRAVTSLTFKQWLRKSVPEVKVPEIVEMLWAVANGSKMGPGEGWFHSGQSRYDWTWLASRHGKESTGTITRQEFLGPADLFDRLDRNHDGELLADDFDWSENSSFVRQSKQARQWFRAIDADSNGRISHAEWEAFFAKAARGKDHLNPDDLRALLQSPPKKEGEKSKDEPSPLVLVKGLLAGELGSIHEGPDIGDEAPDLALKTQDGRQTIRLSDFRGKKPVVLIFGSFT